MEMLINPSILDRGVGNELWIKQQPHGGGQSHTAPNREDMLEELRLKSSRTALLIVDMQNYFLEREGLQHETFRNKPNMKLITSKVRKLLAFARERRLLIVFTQLIYSPDGSDSPHLVHVIKPDRYKNRREIVLARGSKGAEIARGIEPLEDEIVVEKSRYSAFYRTNLENVLREHGVTTILICGVITEACVLATAFDAFSRDFDVVVVRDCVSSWDQRLNDAALEIMKRTVCQIVELDALPSIFG